MGKLRCIITSSAPFPCQVQLKHLAAKNCLNYVMHKMNRHLFPPTGMPFRDYIRGISAQDCQMDSDLTDKVWEQNIIITWCTELSIYPPHLWPQLNLNFDPTPGQLRYIIRTSVGDGPRLLSQHLLAPNGLPLSTAWKYFGQLFVYLSKKLPCNFFEIT